jgi:hypothetical protein
MTSLLDKFTPAGADFRPNTVTELFALRVAQKLNEAKAARHFVGLAESHTMDQLLCAYRRTVRNGYPDAGRGFHTELERIHSNGQHVRDVKLIAVRIERRTIAAAIFSGDHLEHSESRQLSSDNDRALASAVGFVQWILNYFPAESAALEAIADGEFQRRILHDNISQVLRGAGLPIWEIPKQALLEGCGHPALKSRTQLREIATSVWPVVSGTHAKLFIQDAAILGLHVQIERLFIPN